MKVTNEVEHKGKVFLLEVLLMRSNGKLEAMVFRKETNDDIYLHCKVFCSYNMENRYIKDIN